MKVNIGITDKNRQAVAYALNQLLADEHILYNKTRNYHWSVEGPSFMEFHKLYEGQYTQLAEMIDEIAERITALGGTAMGTARVVAQKSTLSEYPLEIVDGSAHVDAVVEHSRNATPYVVLWLDDGLDELPRDVVSG